MTTDATLPNACAAALGTQDDTKLFFRRDNNNAQCLPPVQIGTETLKLFESPLDSLENLVDPLKGQTSDDDLFEPAYKGLVPDDQEGSFDDIGWQPYTGAVRVEQDGQSTCKEWTSAWGDYPIELCCDGEYMGREARSDVARSRLATVDTRTAANQDYAVVYHCLCMFLFFPFSVFVGGGGHRGGEKFEKNVFLSLFFDTNLCFLFQSPKPPNLVLEL